MRRTEAGGLYVEDLKSTNGLRANGVSVPHRVARELTDGDRLTVGTTDLWVIRDAAKQQLDARIAEVSRELLSRLAKNPELLYGLSSRRFEEVMAEIYGLHGFDVELTPATRDGGVDLYVVHHSALGRTLTIVDCKRYRRDRHIGVGMVRELLGTVVDKGASAGVLATTSFFSSGAQDFYAKYPFRLALHDFYDLERLLSGVVSRPDSLA